MADGAHDAKNDSEKKNQNRFELFFNARLFFFFLMLVVRIPAFNVSFFSTFKGQKYVEQR